MYLKKVFAQFTRLIALLAMLTGLTWPQQMSSFDRDRAQGMLEVISNEVRKHYYDPKFRGLDWDAKVAEAKQRIAKTTSFNMAMSEIAAVLDTLDDSHTFFFPPQHANRHEYGWHYQMFGKRCYVLRVRPKSDAEAKGLKSGDEILALNGFPTSRKNLWRMQYLFNILRPQPELQLNLQDPAGNPRQIEVKAKIREGLRMTDLTDSMGNTNFNNLMREGEREAHRMRARFVEMGDELMILKVPIFDFSESEVENMIGRARKHKALIVDLRENPGGSIETLKYFVGGFFDKDVKICDRVGRKESKPIIAKSAHSPFTGKLVVLADSGSASASELFSRVMQLEKRGMVIGDLTSGSVMEARHYNEQMGTDTVLFYGASITDADLIMADGKSLERVGVTPDEEVVPTGADLASGRDPVLAHAAETLGVKTSPEDAGKMFPYEWPEDK